MGAKLSKNVLLGDVLKYVGYNCPAGHEEDSLLDLIEGGGSEISLITLNANENKTYTPDEGKAYKKAVVNVPSVLYAWKETGGNIVYTKATTVTTSDKALVPAATGITEGAITAVGESSITYDSKEYTRYDTGDITLA